MPIQLEIPAGVPIFDLSTVVDDNAYTFAFRWNATDDAWYFDVYTDAGALVAQGLKVVLGVYLGNYLTHPLFSRRCWFAVDTEAGQTQAREATLNDLGTRVQIRSYTPDEVIGGDPTALGGVPA